MLNNIFCYKIDNAIDFLIDSQEKYNQYKEMIKVCLRALLISNDYSIKKLYNIPYWNSSKCLDDNLKTLIDSYYLFIQYSMKSKRSPKLVAQCLLELIEKK